MLLRPVGPLSKVANSQGPICHRRQHGMFEGQPLVDSILFGINAGKGLHDDGLCEYVVAVA
jgi:hypothetical protein